MWILNCHVLIEELSRCRWYSGKSLAASSLMELEFRRYDFERRGFKMKDMLLKIYVKAQILHEDCGQDLIEYALVVALIAFAATAGMSSVANNINTAFSNIGTKLTTYIS
jgi:pilus assembly protein Flp/PilA